MFNRIRRDAFKTYKEGLQKPFTAYLTPASSAHSVARKLLPTTLCHKGNNMLISAVFSVFAAVSLLLNAVQYAESQHFLAHKQAVLRFITVVDSRTKVLWKSLSQRAHARSARFDVQPWSPMTSARVTVPSPVASPVSVYVSPFSSWFKPRPLLGSRRTGIELPRCYLGDFKFALPVCSVPFNNSTLPAGLLASTATLALGATSVSGYHPHGYRSNYDGTLSFEAKFAGGLVLGVIGLAMAAVLRHAWVRDAEEPVIMFTNATVIEDTIDETWTNMEGWIFDEDYKFVFEDTTFRTIAKAVRRGRNKKSVVMVGVDEEAGQVDGGEENAGEGSLVGKAVGDANEIAQDARQVPTDDEDKLADNAQDDILHTVSGPSSIKSDMLVSEQVSGVQEGQSSASSSRKKKKKDGGRALERYIHPIDILLSDLASWIWRLDSNSHSDLDSDSDLDLDSDMDLDSILGLDSDLDLDWDSDLDSDLDSGSDLVFFFIVL
ncbi:hypothetical protein BDW22DRAFT_1430543 [Trametopsis cervina]|nr:hypothetical protein BDW22DRAFT_1430543 [Trametopsis cervina]